LLFNYIKNLIYHIDREFIESLKLQIEEDKKKFHFDPFFRHNLIYLLDVSNEFLIYLMHSNNSIIKAEYADHTEIFVFGRIKKMDNS